MVKGKLTENEAIYKRVKSFHRCMLSNTSVCAQIWYQQVAEKYHTRFDQYMEFDLQQKVR
jgi:hypothetical protein